VVAFSDGVDAFVAWFAFGASAGFLRVWSIIHPSFGYEPLIQVIRSTWDHGRTMGRALWLLPLQGPLHRRDGSGVWVCWAPAVGTDLVDMVDPSRMIDSPELI